MQAMTFNAGFRFVKVNSVLQFGQIEIILAYFYCGPAQLDREHCSSCCWGDALTPLPLFQTPRGNKNKSQSNDNIGPQYDLKTFFPCSLMKVTEGFSTSIFCILRNVRFSFNTT